MLRAGNEMSRGLTTSGSPAGRPCVRARIRSEEWLAVIEGVPGKLFKFITALCFAADVLRAWARRAAARLSDVPGRRYGVFLESPSVLCRSCVVGMA